MCTKSLSFVMKKIHTLYELISLEITVRSTGYVFFQSIGAPDRT